MLIAWLPHVQCMQSYMYHTYLESEWFLTLLLLLPLKDTFFVLLQVGQLLLREVDHLLWSCEQPDEGSHGNHHIPSHPFACNQVITQLAMLKYEHLSIPMTAVNIIILITCTLSFCSPVIYTLYGGWCGWPCPSSDRSPGPLSA